MNDLHFTLGWKIKINANFSGGRKKLDFFLAFRGSVYKLREMKEIQPQGSIIASS